MRLHRFIGNFDLDRAEIHIVDPETRHQIREVLRLRSGSELILGNGRAREARARITAVRPADIVCEVLDRATVSRGPKLELRAYLAILKRENFELAAQKLTELGVSEIIPILTERTVKQSLKEERLLKIIREAAEQSGRTEVPALAPAVRFKDAAKNAREENNIFLHLAGSALPGKLKGPANLWIGPEGGWTEEEVGLARANGFRIVKIGDLTLRAETAAIAGTALLLLN